MHTPWYTPSRVGEHQVVRSISSLRPSLAPSSARDYRRRRTHEKENETRFLSFFFFFLPSLLLFFHSFHTFTVRARVHITKKKKREVRRWGRHEGGGIYFCHEILHFELSVSETAREPCTHTRRACRLASCSLMIRIRVA